MIKIIDNNVYINLKPKDKTYKVIWHFKNYNVILASPFGINIDNYIDREIIVDKTTTSFSDIIKDHYIEISNGFLKSSARYAFYREGINTRYTIDNITELTDNNVIFHYIYDRKTSAKSKIIIPRFLLNGRNRTSYVVVFYVDGKILVKLYNYIFQDFEPVKIYYLDIGKSLDMNDYDRCIKYIEDDGTKSLYTKFYLNNI